MTKKSIAEDRFEERYPGVRFDREFYFGVYHSLPTSREIVRERNRCGRRKTSFQFTDLYNQK